jgi:hypothetical protein
MSKEKKEKKNHQHKGLYIFIEFSPLILMNLDNRLNYFRCYGKI